ncbi:MAG: hypothetical protein ACOH2E_03835 [Candidatus Paracaedibacter sp.]
MTLKKLLISGIFGVLAMCEANAAPYQTLVAQESMGKVDLISTWCSQHPRHHKCHRHHKRVQPFYWYHESFNEKAHHCRHHPYEKRCQRFCNINPGICYR